MKSTVALINYFKFMAMYTKLSHQSEAESN